MRRRTIGLTIATALFLNVLVATAGQTTTARISSVSYSAGRNPQDPVLPEREETNQTLELSPRASVFVSGIAGGPVEIDTTDAARADVQVVRLAATRAELDCYDTVVEHTSDSLKVRHRQLDGARCNNIRASQQVKLVVPRSSQVGLDTIGGDVIIGALDGKLRLNNVAGEVRIGQVQAADLRALAKGLIIDVTRLSGEGISVSNVVGTVQLSVGEDLNANLSVENINGEVLTAGSPAFVRKRTDSGYSIQIGSGGPKISLSNIKGDVKIIRK